MAAAGAVRRRRGGPCGRRWIDSHIEHYGWHAFLDWEAGLFKLESRMHDVMWTPQHFLPAGLYALLRSFRYEHAASTTLVDLFPTWRRQNVARDVPDLLRWLLREPGIVHERRIPGEPLVRSAFDVYLDDGTLIYVKDRCTPADVGGKTFLFLHVTPVNPADLPRHRRRSGFVKYRPQSLVPRPSEMLGGRCLFGVSLPGYPIARIIVGRKTQGRHTKRRILWKAEVAFPSGAVP